MLQKTDPNSPIRSALDPRAQAAERTKAAERAQLLEQARHKMAFSIEEFCARNSISGVTYHKLKQLDKQPVEMHVTKHKVLISIEAEADWRRKCESPSPEELARFAEARRIKSAKAVAASVKSPRHVSKQGPRKHKAPSVVKRPRGRPRKRTK